jgi:molybdopterin-containing oxidoreductase family iron-sulfur binding subunit
MSGGMERRQFLKVLGVSGAGATAAGCGGTAAAERLIPYVIPHEEIVPGIATWYRTTCRECPAGCGMTIRTREGRAVKAEGNPLSPISHGALCARGQSSLHGLYNPDRVPGALAREGESWSAVTWDDAEQRLAQALAQNRGRTVLLTHNLTGTLDRLFDQFAGAFGIERVRYEPFGWEPIRAANRMLFGQDAVPVHDFSNAEVVITFGADFLETWISPIDYAHGFVQGRAYAQGRRGRLIAIGPHQSLTDMNADEWLPVRPGTEPMVALALARLVADAGGAAGGAPASIAEVDVDAAATAAEVSRAKLEEIARAFANGGRSLAVGPGVASMHSGATALAAAVAVLNSAAGNIGRTVRFAQRELHASTPGAGAPGAAAPQPAGQPAPPPAQPTAPAGAAQGAAPDGTYARMQQLIARMRGGQIGALLVYGPNPLYSMPEYAEVADALGRVGFIASFTPWLDETSERAHLVLPDHHFLESWGDYEPRTGVTALIQPVMTPVFNTKQTGDVLLSTARRAAVTLPTTAATFYDYLRERWTREVFPAAGGGGPFDTWWTETLQTGFALAAAATQPAGAGPAVNAGALQQLDFAAPQFAGAEDGYFLIVYPSYKYYDGRLANRPWLQELPDPISKFSWSSWVEIHPETAEALGLDNGHMVEVRTPATPEDQPAVLPVYRHAGTRPDTIAIQLGQGHTGFGNYARDRGVNAFRLLAPQADPVSGGLIFQQVRASLRPTGDWERPVQAGLYSDQRGRQIAQAVTLAAARAADEARGVRVAAAPAGELPGAPADTAAHEAAGGHGVVQHPMDARVTELQEMGGFAPVEVDASPMGYPPPGTHYGEYSDVTPRWGMTIDLDRCIGCSACITACYAENNIGIVGPEQVAKGRILHWIRIERYYEGEGENLETRFLPMLCQHCGNAPCEPVCPVFAAYHTPDGLNAQVYNRCVGTRYCSNNCPYKVRYFNWYSYEWPEPLNWQLNPDVTVREKGVMEKCTFCVQRIRDAENHARLEGRGVRDGEIVPACAQTCPGEAIVFGNMRDPNSRVRQIADSGRAYRVLDQLNTQSAIVYLKRVSEHAAATAEH